MGKRGLIQPPGEFHELDGVRWHVVECAPTPGGESLPAVVLIHGKGGSLYDYTLSPAWESLQIEPARPRLLVIDRPASGHTETLLDRPIGPVEQARRLWQLLDYQGVGEVFLVGHSVGGFLSLRMMYDEPVRVRKALLLAPVAYPDRLFELLAYGFFDRPGWQGAFVGWSSRIISILFRKPFRRQPFGPNLDAIPEGYLIRNELALSKENFRADMRNMAGMQAALEELSGAYEQIRTPVEILVGADDRLIHPSHSRRLAQALPQATLKELPGIGHMIPLAAPEVLRERIRALVS